MLCGFSDHHRHRWTNTTTENSMCLLSVSEFIRLADHYVPVPGGTNNNNYANVELILDIAKRTQVQVCAPGKFGKIQRFLQKAFRMWDICVVDSVVSVLLGAPSGLSTTCEHSVNQSSAHMQA